MTAHIVHAFSAALSLLCCWLLWRYYRRSGAGLLLWASTAFFGFAVANALLLIDFFLIPGADLHLLRNSVTLAALVVLLYGMVWKSI